MSFVSVSCIESYNNSGFVGKKESDIVVKDGKKYRKVKTYGDNGLEVRLYPVK